MERALLDLLNRLEDIGRDHTELYDTDVKEQTGERFVQVFFVGSPEPAAGTEYGMFSEKANAAIHDAFSNFAKQLAQSQEFAAANEESKWRTLNAAVTNGRQIAENF